MEILYIKGHSIPKKNKVKTQGGENRITEPAKLENPIAM